LREQGRQNRFAGAGVGAGDENDLFHFPISKRKRLVRAIW
jgi:hypothetical protein